MTSNHPGIFLILFALIIFSMSFIGCQQKMAREGRLRSFAPSSFFSNGSSARHPVEGTVARGTFNPDEVFMQGKQGGIFVKETAVPLTRRLLERGQERFKIYCSPCHGYVGDGQGMIVSRGFSAPPSFHIDRLREAPAGHFFDVISHGFGAMLSYGDRVPPADRWAIIAYIRALQKSQRVRYSELPPSIQNEFKKLEAGQ